MTGQLHFEVPSEAENCLTTVDGDKYNMSGLIDERHTSSLLLGGHCVMFTRW